MSKFKQSNKRQNRNCRDNSSSSDRSNSSDSCSSERDRIKTKRVVKTKILKIRGCNLSCGSRSSSSEHSGSSSSEYLSKFRSSNSKYYVPKHLTPQLYSFIKEKLEQDLSLMVYGSGAYGSIYNTVEQIIEPGDAVVFGFNQDLLNIDHKPGTADVVVHQDGIYSVTFSLKTDVPVQFAIFVNGQINTASITNVSADVGQLIIRELVALHKNDVVSFRNHTSVAGTIHTSVNTGDTLVNANTEAVFTKIAPLPKHLLNLSGGKIYPVPKYRSTLKKYNFKNDLYNNLYNSEFNEKRNFELSCAEKCLFRELKKKLESEPELSFSDSTAFGSFWCTTSQIVPVEGSILFGANKNVKNMTHVTGTSDITVNKDGVYLMFFNVGTPCGLSPITVGTSCGLSSLKEDTSCESSSLKEDANQTSRFTVFVNGIPNATTTNTNKDAGALGLRQTLSLNAGDVLSVRNHTSVIDDVTIAENNAVFNIYRIGPLLKYFNKSVFVNKIKELECKCGNVKNNCAKGKCKDETFEAFDSKYKELYLRFKNFLIKHVQPNSCWCRHPCKCI